jgi:hypothetical protein
LVDWADLRLVGKEPSSLEPRVVSGDGCREMQLGDAKLGDGGDKGKEPHHIAGAACGGGGACREMQLGDAKLGDGGDEGKESSALGPYVWERL